MKQLLFLFCLLLMSLTTLSAKQRIAPYILDGALAIYSPNIGQGIAVWKTITKQTTGIEYANVTNRLSVRLIERISANIFTKTGAKALGIDYNGGLAYVQLKKDISYMIFTISNIELLKSRLDTLENPVPYRIIENFVIFSASPEIIEYYNFKGLEKIDVFNQVAKELNLSWNKNLIWLDSSFFHQQSILSMGDRIIGTFNVINNQIVVDILTIYDDPQVNQIIKNSMDVRRVQGLTLLDYESGKPSIVGSLYVNFENFVKLGQQIDKAGLLTFNNLIKSLKNINIDLQKIIFPYLQGRLSYVVRAFKPSSNLYDFTFSVGIKNKTNIQQNLKNIVKQSAQQGIKIRYKDLFTQQFYGWEFNEATLWVGVVEDHLVVSSDEKSLITYIQNVYQAKTGFLNKLPIAMRRLIDTRRIGGQMLVRNPEFIQNVELMDWFFARDVLLSLKEVKWDFYLIDNSNITGRRDIFILNFNN